MSVLRGLGSLKAAAQERELEKVNAFYLQKEAEVRLLRVYPFRATTDPPERIRLILEILPTAQGQTPDSFRQEEARPVPEPWNIKKISQVCNSPGGVPAVRQRPEQTAAVRRDQRHGLFQDPEEVG